MALENLKKCYALNAMNTWVIFQENLLTAKVEPGWIHKSGPAKIHVESYFEALLIG